MALNSTDLIAAGKLLYGKQWQTPLARDLKISDRTVRRWVAGTVPIPPGVFLEIEGLLERKQEQLAALIRTKRPGWMPE